MIMIVSNNNTTVIVYLTYTVLVITVQVGNSDSNIIYDVHTHRVCTIVI